MIAEAVGRALGAGVTNARRVPGGDINEAMRVELDDGRAVFVKHSDTAAPGGFEAEAAGLRWLAEPDALPLPEPLAWEEGWLALEWVEPGSPGPDFDETLGRGLAVLHDAGADAFAGEMLVGPIRLPGDAAPDWPTFYGERRLAPLARMAADRGALPPGTEEAVDRVIARLPELCGPPEPPARLHGDLWTGNVMAAADGSPWLVDPAAYGGHREIDLAMLRLFGRPSERFWAAYAEVRPLAEGSEERVELNQLLPLLVHAVLFGGGYGASVQRIAQRFL